MLKKMNFHVTIIVFVLMVGINSFPCEVFAQSSFEVSEKDLQVENIKQVINDYVSFSKAGETSKIKDLITNYTNEVIRAENSFNQINDYFIPSSPEVIELYYIPVSEDVPNLIYRRQQNIIQIKLQKFNANIAKVCTKFNFATKKSLFMLRVIYLFKDEIDEWKIYKIEPRPPFMEDCK